MNNEQEKEVNIQNKYSLFAIIFSITVVFSIVIDAYIHRGGINKSKDVVKAIQVNNVEDFFEDLELQAKAVFVWDARDHQILYEYNSDKQLPLASLTKLMTTLVADGSVPKKTIITVSKENLSEEGDSGLRAGERWTLSNLIDMTLVSSSNDGASAIASVAEAWRDNEKKDTAVISFLDAMNAKAQAIGMSKTHFSNVTGLDINESESGSYGSAKDIAILMEYILNNNPKLLEATVYDGLEINSKEFKHKVINTNEDVKKIPGILGSKTGYTDLAGGNLVIAFDVGIGHPIIISVLGSSQEGRFEDVEKLIDASIKHFSAE